MKFKDWSYKRKLIKQLDKELEYVWRFNWAVDLCMDIVNNENYIKKYEEAKVNAESIKKELITKFGRDFIL